MFVGWHSSCSERIQVIKFSPLMVCNFRLCAMYNVKNARLYQNPIDYNHVMIVAENATVLPMEELERLKYQFPQFKITLKDETSSERDLPLVMHSGDRAVIERLSTGNRSTCELLVKTDGDEVSRSHYGIAIFSFTSLNPIKFIKIFGNKICRYEHKC